MTSPNTAPIPMWRGPRWTLAALLALISMIGPFAIDTYLPAFAAMRVELGASAAQMQQTLSAYLLTFAVANLFHGAMADSFGRRPVLLWGMALFALASIGCALSQTIGQLIFFRSMQGLCAGAGVVVSRAVVRDLFPPQDAQRIMSQIAIFFGLAPALAPLIGGVLSEYLGWHSIFWMMAALSVLVWVCNFRFLPESLPVQERQTLDLANLLRGYAALGTSSRFLLLMLAGNLPFCAIFLYLLSSPVFLGELLGLPPTRFFWFFVCMVAGTMSGSWLSGRLIGRVSAHMQVRHGFALLLVMGTVNLLACALLPLQAAWALPLIGFLALGWALLIPVITILALDVFPQRRGMASSFFFFFGSAANGIVAGVVSPLVMHSAVALSVTSLLLVYAGLWAWLLYRKLPAPEAKNA